MNRVDAHQHYWRLVRGDYAWLSPRQVPLYRDFEPRDLADQLTESRVGATVVVQAASTEAETRFLMDVARRHSTVKGVVGWVDFEATDVHERILALVREGAGKLKGLRPMVQDIDDPQWLARTSLDAAFAAILKIGLTFDALVTPLHLEVLRERLTKHPTLKAVLDHAGKPDIAGRAFDPWALQIERLARTTSLHCKLSGLLTQAHANASSADLDDFVAHVFACFGPERVMWGSDWPVLTLRTSYREWLEMALELVARHAPGHEEAVFATNAVRFYGLSL
jgi:L-fuconolactonase